MRAQEDSSQCVTGNKFVRNDGQLLDENRQPSPGVFYYTNFQNCRHYFQKSLVEHVFYNFNSELNEVDAMHRFDMNFEACNEQINVDARDQQEDFLNYYLAHCPDGITDVPIFQTLNYNKVWDGINIDFSKSFGLDYLITIEQNADPNLIDFNYRGATSVALQEDGLVIRGPYGFLHYTFPLAWQIIDGNKIEVNCKFNLSSTHLTFTCDAYDANHHLYIIVKTAAPIPNPTITDHWTTYYGDAGGDVKNDVFINTSNLVYTVGSSSSLLNLTTTGTAYFGNQGGNDALVVKFNALRVRKWGTYYGGSNNDQGQFIQVVNGYVYFAGTLSPGFPFCTTCNGYQGTQSIPFDIFLVKIRETNGKKDLVNGMSTPLGGTSWNELHGMTSDIYGNIYLGGVVFGNTSSTSLPYSYSTQPNCYNQGPYIFSGGNDGFIVKFNSSNDLIWVTAFGGTNNGAGCPGNCEEVNGMTCDNLGNLYITGTTGSLGVQPPLIAPVTAPPANHAFPLTDPFPVPGIAFVRDYSGGLGDAFVAKFDVQNRLMWCTAFGGTGTENWHNLAHNNHGIAVSNQTGDIYITGSTQSIIGGYNYPDFPIVPYSFPDVFNQTNNTNSAGTFDLYIARFTAQCQLFYSTFYGGAGDDYGIGVSVENGTSNATYYTGTTLSSNFPLKPNPYIGSFFQNTLKGGSDAFLVKMQGNLSRTYSTYFGGTSSENGYSIAAGPQNVSSQNILLCGSTQSTAQFPLHNPGNGAFYDPSNNTSGNTSDGFISNFRNNSTLRPAFGGITEDYAAYNPNMFLIPEQSRRSLQNESTLNLYPQPAIDNIIIPTNYNETFEVEFFDMQGKLVDKIFVTSEFHQIRHSITNYSPGLYFVKINSASQKAVGKFIKLN